MAAAAEIGERPDRVERDRLALGDLLGDLDLVRIAGERVDRFRARDLSAGHRVIGRHDLAHASLKALEIVGRERRSAVKIIVEAVFDRGPDRRLRLGEQVCDGISEHVSGRVAELGKRSPAIVDPGVVHGAPASAMWTVILGGFCFAWHYNS